MVLNIITVTNTHYRYNQTPAALKTRLHDIFVMEHLTFDYSFIRKNSGFINFRNCIFSNSLDMIFTQRY